MLYDRKLHLLEVFHDMILILSENLGLVQSSTSVSRGQNQQRGLGQIQEIPLQL